MRTLLLILMLYVSQFVQAETLPPYQPHTGREQPLVAVVAENGMTELVDFMVPFGLLSRAGVAKVIALSTREGPVQMMPALKIGAEATTAQFEQRYPQGVDYLIVPAVHHSDAQPGRVLDETLEGIAARYGSATAALIANQLEHPRR